MKIRFGFVAMSVKLVDASPSKTITYKALDKLSDDRAKLYHLKKLTKQNLDNTLRILTHADAHQIKVYRFTSKLIPLVTHTSVLDWNYQEEFRDDFLKIGNFIKDHHMRVSAHPDHFTLLNSPKSEVIEASIRDLEYHVSLFEAMGLGAEAKLVLHVGGSYSDKENALERFVRNFNELSTRYQERIMLENDDKSYTAAEVLKLCRNLKVPMVLDVHHHSCNNNGEKLLDLLPYIFETWVNEYWPPKVHFSSPKSEKQYRHHADDINVDDFMKFLDIAKLAHYDFDVMLEAKNKDVALFNLMDALKQKENIEIVDEASISY